MKKLLSKIITYLIVQILLSIFFMGLYLMLTIITNENNLVINIKYFKFLSFLIALLSWAITIVIFEQKDKNNEKQIR
jgi:hypothetical protein